MEYRSDIQILRGIAVLLVFLFHLEVTSFENGYLGVDVFFVISGYLMALLYDRGSAWDFYERRLKRLIPAYVLAIGLTVLAAGLVTVPVDFNQVLKQSLFGFLGISNIGFWLDNSYFSSTAFKPLLSLWSLGVELQYYLFVPLVLPLLRHRAWAFAVIFLGSLLSVLYMTTVSPKTGFFWLPFRVWEFLAGAAAAWYFASAAGERRGLVTSMASVAVLLAVLLYPINTSAQSVVYGHPGVAAVVTCIATAIVLSRPLHSAFSDGNAVGRFFVSLGKYSYSIYLVHFPIIVLINYTSFGGTHLGYDDLASAVSIVVLTALLSVLFFHFVESIRDKAGFWKRFLVIVAVSLSFVAGGFLWNANQFSAVQHKIFAAWEDRSVYRCGKLFRILNPFESVCPVPARRNGKAVLLVGNSHADSIKEKFADVLARFGTGTYFYVANQPLMGASGGPKTLLHDVRRKQVEAVVVHYSPSFYKNEAHLNRLMQVLSDLKETEVPVYLIAPVPTNQFHVPKALYERSLNPKHDIARQSRSQYLQYNEKFFAFVEEQGLMRNVYWPHEILCPHDDCLLESEGRPIYFDSNHLTLTGAGLLTRIFEDLAERISAGER